MCVLVVREWDTQSDADTTVATILMTSARVIAVMMSVMMRMRVWAWMSVCCGTVAAH